MYCELNLSRCSQRSLLFSAGIGDVSIEWWHLRSAVLSNRDP